LVAADAVIRTDGEAPAGFLFKRPSPLSLVTTTPVFGLLPLSRAYPTTSALIGAHVVDLISHASEILADTSAERVHVPVLLSMMLDHIDRYSDDPELGAATLAAKFRCSERYVHRLF
jgi:hypothetical protein